MSGYYRAGFALAYRLSERRPEGFHPDVEALLEVLSESRQVALDGGPQIARNDVPVVRLDDL